MTTIDQNRLKGNFSQNTVAAWLSRACLVRPVAEGTDIGVDLYCESIQEASPYLHFWAQVKTISPSSILEENGRQVAYFDFETRHLRYWANQPIPVYAFLVPINDWPPEAPKRIFGVRVTEYVVKNEIPKQTTIRLKTVDCFDADNIDTDLQQFISEIVPWDSSALLVQKGIIAPIDTPSKTFDSRFPAGIGFRHLDRILINIRDASIMGLIDALTFEHVQPDKRLLRKRFEQVATLFEDQMNNFGLSVLVRSAHFDGDIEKAKKYINDALVRIQADPTLSEEDKTDRSAKIRVLLNDFE